MEKVPFLLSSMGSALKEGFDHYFDFSLFSSLRLFGKSFWIERNESLGKNYVEYLCSVTKENACNALKEFKYLMNYFRPVINQPILKQFLCFLKKGVGKEKRLNFNVLFSLLLKICYRSS